jgi:hypothetical protein
MQLFCIVGLSNSLDKVLVGTGAEGLVYIQCEASGVSEALCDIKQQQLVSRTCWDR